MSLQNDPLGDEALETFSDPMDGMLANNSVDLRRSELSLGLSEGSQDVTIKGWGDDTEGVAQVHRDNYMYIASIINSQQQKLLLCVCSRPGPEGDPCRDADSDRVDHEGHHRDHDLP